MGFRNKNVIDCRNKNIFLIVFGVLVIFLTIIFIMLSIKHDNLDNENIRYLNDIIEGNEDKVGQKTYVDVESISSSFAVYDDKTDAYYYVYDGHYYYIVYLKEKKYNEISSKDLANNPYRLEGISREFSSDVMDIAIEDWNENLSEDEDVLDESNFYNIFGDVYLDQTSQYSETTSMYNVLAFLTGVTGLALTIIGFVRMINFSLNVKKFDGNEIDSIESEMSDKASFYYKNIKLYLTSNYIIMLNGKFKVYKYSDVLWMYPYEQRYNGIRTNKAINILTKDGKISTVASVAYVTKNQKEIYDEVWNTIIQKNPSIVLGYSSENIKHFNDVRKEIKRNKKNGI